MHFDPLFSLSERAVAKIQALAKLGTTEVYLKQLALFATSLAKAWILATARSLRENSGSKCI